MTDYTLIKIQLLEPYPPTIIKLLSKLPAASSTFPPHVYLPAATLRPETMYGQTNVFLLPRASTECSMWTMPLCSYAQPSRHSTCRINTS